MNKLLTVLVLCISINCGACIKEEINMKSEKSQLQEKKNKRLVKKRQNNGMDDITNMTNSAISLSNNILPKDRVIHKAPENLTLAFNFSLHFNINLPTLHTTTAPSKKINDIEAMKGLWLEQTPVVCDKNNVTESTYIIVKVRRSGDNNCYGNPNGIEQKMLGE